MRLLLCGGGTAGHVNPAIAVAEELKSRNKEAEILFIGREGGRENELITGAGFNLKTLKIEGIRRSLSTDNIRRVITALKAKEKAEKIIKDFAPDVVLGTGGYVCWPVITAADKLDIPTALHESNVSPGLTTRLVSNKCDMIFLNNEKTKEYLSKKTKTRVVGNPLKKDFERVDRESARRKMGIKNDEIFILSFGGSIGAKKLNETIVEVMEKHSSKTEKIKHLHATGKRYYNQAEKKYMDRPHGGCRIVPYINNMAASLSAADIVICRCGAMTLSELSAIGVASILIPSPNVSANHQYKNGIPLFETGAADLIEEKNLTSELLTERILFLENNKIERKNRAKNIKAFFKPNAAKEIVEGLFALKNRQ